MPSDDRSLEVKKRNILLAKRGNYKNYKKRKATYKRTQQLPTMLGLMVHRGKDTTHKILYPCETAWKSCANGFNIVVLRFGDHGTKEMFGVVGSKV